MTTVSGLHDEYTYLPKVEVAWWIYLLTKGRGCMMNIFTRLWLQYCHS